MKRLKDTMDKNPPRGCMKLIDGFTVIHLLRYNKVEGAYAIFLYANGRHRRINRLNGVDIKGRLYVGGTGDLMKRIEQVIKSILENQCYHPIGEIYTVFPNLRRRFPIDSLYVAIFPSENGLLKEKEMKREYKRKFGENPPFNGN